MPYSNEIPGFISKSKRYVVKNRRPLAFGRASVLWLCDDEDLHQEVVIKAFREAEMPSRAWERFLREVKVLQSLNHPNILSILDWGYEGTDKVSDPFVVLPYCEGGNLRALLEERNFLTPEIFIPLMEQISSAVDFAHKQGIIHSDIKPENLLFLDSEKKNICLSDFGIAKILPFNEAISTHESFLGAGSTAYLSPEQLIGEQQSHLSDIYALSIVTYEALTGKLPFNTLSPPLKQMMQKVTDQLIDPQQVNPLLSRNMADALLLGLSRNPSDRPQSASKLCSLLKEHSTNIDTIVNPIHATASQHIEGASKTPRIFISYSHKDTKWLKRLQVHLKPLERHGDIARWDDTLIQPGTKWKDAINEALSTARVAILLVSADFLASDFIVSNELPPLLKAAESRGVIIFPIILSPCLYEETENLSQFQSVNPPSRPLSNMIRSQQEQTLVNVSKSIQNLLTP